MILKYNNNNLETYNDNEEEEINDYSSGNIIDEFEVNNNLVESEGSNQKDKRKNDVSNIKEILNENIYQNNFEESKDNDESDSNKNSNNDIIDQENKIEKLKKCKNKIIYPKPKKRNYNEYMKDKNDKKSVPVFKKRFKYI